MNMKDILDQLGSSGATSFSKNLSKDLMEIPESKNTTVEAFGRVIGYIATVAAILEFLKDQGVPTESIAPTLQRVGEELGRGEARKMLEDMNGLKSMNFASKSSGTDPLIKNAWKEQL
jgi:hypothetical protein